MKLSLAEINALRSIQQNGVCLDNSMAVKLQEKGLIAGSPYMITEKGYEVLAELEHPSEDTEDMHK